MLLSNYGGKFFLCFCIIKSLSDSITASKCSVDSVEFWMRVFFYGSGSDFFPEFGSGSEFGLNPDQDL